MTTDNRFPSLDPGEARTLTFDFSPDLAVGETLTGAPTVAVRVVRGTDATPNAILKAGAQFDATSKQWLQPVGGGNDDTDYGIAVTSPTTNVRKTLVCAGVLPIRKA